MENEDKGYWKRGYFYVENRIVCGICGCDMGESKKEEGQLGYCGCENDDNLRNYLNR